MVQDWIAARLPLRDQPFHVSLFAVAPPTNHCWGTGVSVPELRTTLKNVAVAGSLPEMRGSRGVHAAKSHRGTATTTERHGILSVFVPWFLPSWSRSSWWTAFSRRALHLLYRASVTITRLVRTVFPPCRYDVMRGVCLVELSSPRGGTRVPYYLG